jgi:subtilisin family serine protease
LSTVISAQVLDCVGDGKNSDLLDAISWVIETHTKPAIINMSLGGDRSPSIENAVKAAVAAGISVIVAAGNSNVNACTQSPAAVAEAITVAASTQSNSRAKFSNFGPCVDIFAPGVDILAATTVKKARNGWTFASGTSFAAPLVAGVAALLLEKNPEWTPIQLGAELKNMAAVAVLSKDSLSGSPNVLLQAPSAKSKLPILVNLADPSYLPMLGYHTSSIFTAELILVICSFICATLALLATSAALYRRNRRRKMRNNTPITDSELKRSVLSSNRPSVFL